MSDILIIQAQRMGDLIMSFPLCSWLIKQQNATVWVMAEEIFFKELLPLSPQVFYIPLHAQNKIIEKSFDHVINLSHRQDAANFAGCLQTNNYTGMVNREGQQKIYGEWQLYRASLTHNNHYNRFHWVDLNTLDFTSPAQTEKYIAPLRPNKQNGKIGLFVGASDANKRPDPEFWAELATNLYRKGYKPVFLGGKDEENIAAQAAHKANMPHINLAGKFSLYELMTFMQELELFITPDTGPMHLASCTGVLTFNLSMGSVHPFETAPYPVGHYVLQPTLSCSPCWQCTKNSQLCRKSFQPIRIANLIDAVLRKKTLPHIPNLTLYRTTRNKHGLYDLDSLYEENMYKKNQGEFWRSFFFWQLLHNDMSNDSIRNNIYHHDAIIQAQFLRENVPTLYHALIKELPKILKNIIYTQKTRTVFTTNKWKEYMPFLRPFTSYIQLHLENENYTPASIHKVLGMVSDINTLLTHA